MKKKTNRVQSLNKKQCQLVEQNLDLTVNLSKRYAALAESRRIDRADLEQEAALGLCEAALRYNPSKNAEFRTYAFAWCEGRILNFINGHPEAVNDDVEQLSEDVPDDDEREVFVLRVGEMMSKLKEKERMVVCLIYGIESVPMDFAEVARSMCLSVRRVHAIYERAMVKLEALA